MRRFLKATEIQEDQTKSLPIITKHPFIAMKPQKHKWDNVFSSLKEKYKGLTISWNEEETECLLAFVLEKGITWSLKGSERRAKEQEITPNPETTKIFFRKMKSEMVKEQLTIKLLPNRTNPTELKISFKENEAPPMDFKGFHSSFADLILKKETIITKEKKETQNSKEERKNIIQATKPIKKNQSLISQQEIHEQDILSLLFEIGENILFDKRNISFLKCNRKNKKNIFMIPYFIDGRMSLSTPQGFVNIKNFFECIAVTLNQYSKSNNFVNIIGVAPSFTILFHFQDHSLADLLKGKKELQSAFLEQTQQIKGGVFFSSLPISLMPGEKSIKKLTLDKKDNKSPRNETQPLIGQNNPAQPFTFANNIHEENFKYHLAELADNPGEGESNNMTIYYLSYLLHVTRLFHLLSYNFQDENSRKVCKDLRDAIRHSHYSYKKIYEIIEGFVQACRTNNLQNITNAIHEVKIKLEKESKNSYANPSFWDDQIKEIKGFLTEAAGDVKIKAQDALLFSCSISGKFRNHDHKYRELYRKLGHQDFKKYYLELREELIKKFL